MHWISVKDKLPPIDVEVIGFYPKSDKFNQATLICVYIGNDLWWCACRGDDPVELSMPTHWMPLPELPKHPK